MTNATTPENQVVARGTEPVALLRRAVIYLRVSTPGQVNTDRDAEGFSIPAQRDACMRKAEAMGAMVVGEYADLGESARSSGRPQLQAMLSRLSTDRDVDYVIVHKVDRLARNRADDVTINLAIQGAGARLVSVTENIDQTPTGMLLHGIMSSVAEFYSGNLSAEITTKMAQKAKKGAYPGRAPIGYLNVREKYEGNEIRTIALDEERAPLVQWAFEVYARGEYSLRQLTEALADKGLTTPATLKYPEKPLRMPHVHKLLTNRFYTGLFSWGGVEYTGTHEPLVTADTFARVQATMATRRVAGEKSRIHEHYLKGTVFCARCQSRLGFNRAAGNGGQYDYFMCLGRHSGRTSCDLPYLRLDEVEEALTRHYSTIELEPSRIEIIRDRLLAMMRSRTKQADQLARRARKRILRLEAERKKLLQAHFAGAVPLDLLKEEQDRITQQLADAGGVLANTEVNTENIEVNLWKALRLASNMESAYRDGEPATRRLYNQAIFEEVGVDVTGVIYARLADPFALLLMDDILTRISEILENAKDPHTQGWNEDLLVEVSGLEPPTSTLRTWRSTS